ncbi:MAG: hypothetical protein LBC83_05115 [Oscillospiraceae bacterium]|jgi:ABC-type cobalamin/Fe3+-siderophores transport system ATPase subunit|nr:hypothetical protein [Oscillospiraceae bacterium]
MAEYSRGSEWRRWDLHLHTASSYDYANKSKDADELLCMALKKGEVAAAAITDHFTIDKDRIRRLRAIAPDIVFFPGVELRTDKGGQNIHVILIFSDQSDLDILSEDFNVFRREAQNPNDDEKIYWDYKSIVKFAEDHSGLISIHAGRKQNGMDKELTSVLPYRDAVKDDFGQTVKIFEMGQPRDLDDYRKNVFPTVGVRPMVICSDNHDPRDYPTANLLWIKADVTFNGLKQVLYEPEDRVYIGPTAPDAKEGYRVIRSLTFQDELFQTNQIVFSDQLTCIIGGKSTGKSILLHNLAWAIDKKQVEGKLEETGANGWTFSGTTVTWADGVQNTATIGKERRKIVYIPQTFLNRLSDKDEETTEIDKMIQNIVLQKAQAQEAYDRAQVAVKEYKPVLVKEICDLLQLHNDLADLLARMKECGDQAGIEVEIKKLSEQKDKLSQGSSLTEDELKDYEDAVLRLDVIGQQIVVLQNDIKAVSNVRTLVAEAQLPSGFSAPTQALLRTAIKDIIEKADEAWSASKILIVKQLMDALAEQMGAQEKYNKIKKGLHDKVQSNKAVADLSEKIRKEKQKLKMFLEMKSQRNTLKANLESAILQLAGSMQFFRETYELYASTVNENAASFESGLEFSVKVPFRSEAFIGALSDAVDIKSLKKLIQPDDFTADQYTPETVRNLIAAILNGDLKPKGRKDKEAVLRTILSDWYNITYSVKMDADSIEVMSPGKKALVLLRLIISSDESASPILIDQPEDDLDNRSIFNDLVEFIKEKKKKRQIIVVTHNANIVLGADAEEVIIANQDGCDTKNRERRFEYRSGSIENDVPDLEEDGTIKGGVLSRQGIQQHICEILEGGEKAFELRKHKYHI